MECFAETISRAACTIVRSQPAMAPLFFLSNSVLDILERSNNVDMAKKTILAYLTEFDHDMSNSVATIAENTFSLIPNSDLTFVYSFSSTIVSALLNAKAKGRQVRVGCTESRPYLEGHKLAKVLAAKNIDVTMTYDCAMGLLLNNSRIAFMGCDCMGRPGIVNKAGSLMLALICKELSIPLYVLASSDKIVNDDLVFEFERMEHRGQDIWSSPPKGVDLFNRPYEIIPASLVSGIITEKGILSEKDLECPTKDIKINRLLHKEMSFIVQD